MGPATNQRLHLRNLSWSYRLLWLFCFLGPIGRLLPIPKTPANFRFFYLLLPLGILVFICTRVTQRGKIRMAAVALLGVYLALTMVEPLIMNTLRGGMAKHPAPRVMLILCLLGFTTAAADILEVLDDEKRAGLIVAFLYGYLISLGAGYVFMVASKILHIVPMSIFDPVYVINDGFRFSPGSYPNEYSNVSSFACAVMVLLLLDWNRGQQTAARRLLHFCGTPQLMVLIPLALWALFLARTRSGYLSFVVSFLYLMPRVGRRVLWRLAVPAVVMLVILVPVGYYFRESVALGATMVVSWLGMAIEDTTKGHGSLAERYTAWRIAYRAFERSPWFGTGFGTAGDIHNLYLELLNEVGVIGVLMMSLAGAVIIYSSSHPTTTDQETGALFRRIRNLACFHVLFFAGSNHNMNHFLTWFAVLLCFAAPVTPVRGLRFSWARSKSTRASSSRNSANPQLVAQG